MGKRLKSCKLLYRDRQQQAKIKPSGLLFFDMIFDSIVTAASIPHAVRRVLQCGWPRHMLLPVASPVRVRRGSRLYASRRRRWCRLI